MDAQKKKDWTKNAIIVFLTIILLLTLFSNTITNYSLPQVSTGQVTSGSITEVVRGTGTVEASDPYKLNAEETRVIDSVLVAQGDHVELGDPIILLSDIESKELQQAEKELADLEEKYYEEMFTAGVTAETIAKARSGNYDSLAELQAKVKDVEDRISAARELVNNYQNEVYVYKIIQSIQDKNIDLSKFGEEELKALVQAEVETMNAENSFVSSYSESTEADKDRVKWLVYEAQKKLAEITAAATIADYEAQAEKLKTKTAVDNAQTLLDTAKANLDDLVKEQDALMKDIGIQIKLQSYAEEIVKKQEEVQKLQAKSTGATITAPVSGTIQSLSKVAGESIEAGKEICTIIPDGKDMTVKIQVSKEQAKKVSVGAQADLADSWYYADAVCILKAISDDPENPGKVNLAFSVAGSDIVIGQSLTLSVGSTTKKCDFIVPKSAIKSDNSGKYVYVIVQKSSPLGNRYIAEKRKIEIEAEDDTKVAIKGEILQGDFVVTTSNKMIESGKQVRLSESSAN